MIEFKRKLQKEFSSSVSGRYLPNDSRLNEESTLYPSGVNVD